MVGVQTVLERTLTSDKNYTLNSNYSETYNIDFFDSLSSNQIILPSPSGACCRSTARYLITFNNDDIKILILTWFPSAVYLKKNISKCLYSYRVN